MPSAVVYPDAVQNRLRQLLFALLEQIGANSFVSAEAIPNDVDLTTVGITSIDFLDFAISVEDEFKVEILEAIEPDELPLTLDGWRQEVCKRLASREG
jgi:acyl carrier protein